MDDQKHLPPRVSSDRDETLQEFLERIRSMSSGTYKPAYGMFLDDWGTGDHHNTGREAHFGEAAQ